MLFAGIFIFFACGPSAKEKAEKAKQDSIRIADSTAQVQAELKAKQLSDSLAQVKEQMKKDSIAKAEEAAKKKTTPKVKKEEPKKEDPKKIGGGRRS